LLVRGSPELKERLELYRFGLFHYSTSHALRVLMTAICLVFKAIVTTEALRALQFWGGAFRMREAGKSDGSTCYGDFEWEYI
jgi:hypothetical protein